MSKTSSPRTSNIQSSFLIYDELVSNQKKVDQNDNNKEQEKEKEKEKETKSNLINQDPLETEGFSDDSYDEFTDSSSSYVSEWSLSEDYEIKIDVDFEFVITNQILDNKNKEEIRSKKENGQMEKKSIKIEIEKEKEKEKEKESQNENEKKKELKKVKRKNESKKKKKLTKKKLTKTFSNSSSLLRKKTLKKLIGRIPKQHPSLFKYSQSLKIQNPIDLNNLDEKNKTDPEVLKKLEQLRIQTLNKNNSNDNKNKNKNKNNLTIRRKKPWLFTQNSLTEYDKTAMEVLCGLNSNNASFRIILSSDIEEEEEQKEKQKNKLKRRHTISSSHTGSFIFKEFNGARFDSKRNVWEISDEEIDWLSDNEANIDNGLVKNKKNDIIKNLFSDIKDVQIINDEVRAKEEQKMENGIEKLNQEKKEKINENKNKKKKFIKEKVEDKHKFKQKIFQITEKMKTQFQKLEENHQRQTGEWTNLENEESKIDPKLILKWNALKVDEILNKRKKIIN
ncbi:hypothetical protein M0812_10485 [Anaeramoeba flamelloides]|uniref:Uncharacterized protein n=1 Tax=Anaeramoeba flamelloides TaxID=1746091 RepID=A0AAV7ZRP9_9EUKA|nr:hypothetical protein M0812_10485 [Anaeramoeba flamelloides]